MTTKDSTAKETAKTEAQTAKDSGHTQPHGDPAASAAAAHADAPAHETGTPTSAAGAAPATPAAPKPAPYVVPKTLAGQTAEIALETRQTAGGDTDFLVVEVVNALAPAPGTILTTDQVEAIAGAGWKVRAVSALQGSKKDV